MRKTHPKSFISFLTIIVAILKPCCALICPNLTSISPCSCNRPSSSTALYIDCSNKKLNDSQMNHILNAFLFPGISPVYSIQAQFNRLTKVPTQISKFPSLSFVYLDYNAISEIPGKRFLNTTNGTVYITLVKNRITSVPLGAFSFPFASSVTIGLSENPISVLPDGAFNFPSAVYVGIELAASAIRKMPSSAVFNFPLVDFFYINLAGNEITSITSQLNFPLATTAIVFLNSNKITTVPSCAFKFPIAQWVKIDLSSNLITNISPGAFNFPSSYIDLNLDSNQISVIPPGTFFQGTYQRNNLANNRLKRLESDVFKSPLNNMIINSYSSIDTSFLIIRGNPIDCSTAPCHLAWLLKSTNTSQMLRHIIAYGVCSTNGFSSPPFSALNSFNFSSCVTF